MYPYGQGLMHTFRENVNLQGGDLPAAAHGCKRGIRSQFIVDGTLDITPIRKICKSSFCFGCPTTGFDKGEEPVTISDYVEFPKDIGVFCPRHLPVPLPYCYQTRVRP